MSVYITTDESGHITASADWPFPGSTLCTCDVVRYPDGRLYREDALPPVYAVPGSADQRIGGECPTGGVLMSGLRPEDVKDVSGVVIGTWIASGAGSWEYVYTAPSRIRAERDRRLEESTWIVERHRDQLANGRETTLTDVEYQDWLSYRQALRDLPQQEGFPWDGSDDPACPWPVEPFSK